MGRFDGKPGTRICHRVACGPSEAVEHFTTPVLKAFYFAARAESPSCWPRVLAGTMTQERFHERQARMMKAILRVTNGA